MISRAELRLRVFTAMVAVVAALALGFTLEARPVRLSIPLVVLVVVAMLSEVLSVRYSFVSVSITVSVCAAANMLFGPAAGGLVTALSTVPASLMVKDRPLLRGSYNLGQLALSGLAGGWAYTLAGGKNLAEAPLTGGQIPQVVIPLAVLSLSTFCVNTTLVGAFVALRSRNRFLEVWKSSFAWTIPTQVALAVLALALAQVVASEGLVGLGLLIVPLAISQQFYERYTKLRDTYADMVRSLVAVIEAKDAYTRGHSERVAQYSVEIARRLGFDDKRIERIELAALLHDLGKVGISKGILSKEGRLDHEEFQSIRRHPDIGAHIIEAVPFLADIVPFISSHHERIDGSGYGAGLQGSDIPIEARVLSVADSFDAMTSSRPYRPARSREETIRELRRCAGRQFDQVIVEVLVESLGNESAANVTEDARVTDEAV